MAKWQKVEENRNKWRKNPFTKKGGCGNVGSWREGVKIGGSAMETKVGDTVRSILNGIEYKVKRIVKRMAVLESQDGKSQIMTELENLSLFYKKKRGKAV